MEIKLHKERHLRRQLMLTSGPNSQMISKEFKTTCKLLAVVIAQVTLTGIPGTVSAVYGFTGVLYDKYTRSVLLLLFQLNHSINFILYNSFDSEFRNDILALLGLAKTAETQELLMDNLNAASTGMRTNAASEGMRNMNV